MGIPRLVTRLQHKAENNTWPMIDTDLHSLSSKIAIIDGPGLAFHVFDSHIKAFAGTPEQLGLFVDYNALAARLISFLDDLQRRGFQM